ncbi:hypothetical protein BCO71033_04888 [Burkholderia contaminans]|uniref:Uncharacterized protein n=1 Tax=Burkholderia contaminans TaxID=488447 RepID=A0A6P3AK39_9BURK|nr:hypothetical protein BCO71033_04888 [Burkholderia contaminans]
MSAPFFRHRQKREETRHELSRPRQGHAVVGTKGNEGVLALTEAQF